MGGNICLERVSSFYLRSHAHMPFLHTCRSGLLSGTSSLGDSFYKVEPSHNAVVFGSGTYVWLVERNASSSFGGWGEPFEVAYGAELSRGQFALNDGIEVAIRGESLSEI